MFFSYLAAERMHTYRTIWDTPSIRSTHNCYAYAFRHLDKTRKTKLQPGEVAKIPTIPKKEYRCDTLLPNVLRDFPEAIITSNGKPCPTDYYKIAFYVDPGIDYHLYRQESNGLWTHKLGTGYVKDVDVDKRPITDPNTANRNYGKYNYTIPCANICYPKQPLNESAI